MYPPIHILAIEDDDVDAECLQRHFQKQGNRYHLTVVTDGLKALQTLRGEDGCCACHPHLILLDLNLPVMDGLSFLEALRQDPTLQQAIVFVLTTSNLPADKAAAYNAGVAGYVLKNNIAGFLEWLDSYCMLVELPQNAYPRNGKAGVDTEPHASTRGRVRTAPKRPPPPGAALSPAFPLRPNTILNPNGSY